MIRDLIRILDISTNLKLQTVVTDNGSRISGKLVAKSKYGYGIVLSHATHIKNDNSMYRVASKDVVFHKMSDEN